MESFARVDQTQDDKLNECHCGSEHPPEMLTSLSWSWGGFFLPWLDFGPGRTGLCEHKTSGQMRSCILEYSETLSESSDWKHPARKVLRGEAPPVPVWGHVSRWETSSRLTCIPTLRPLQSRHQTSLLEGQRYRTHSTRICRLCHISEESCSRVGDVPPPSLSRAAGCRAPCVACSPSEEQLSDRRNTSLGFCAAETEILHERIREETERPLWDLSLCLRTCQCRRLCSSPQLLSSFSFYEAAETLWTEQEQVNRSQTQ